MNCPSCGASNPEGAKFCNECATRLAPVAEPERRQLTVMFCDLVGSTELSRRLDPEDLREVIQAYQSAAGEVIQGYEGHVAQYLGDGLLAYFGFPQAHELDADRAVRAGLEIVETMADVNERLTSKFAVSLSVRIGIHTGLVVVGEVGSGSTRETLALGDTTNIAARVEGAAEPDSVVVSETTWRLISDRFDALALGAQALRGVEEPLQLHRIVGFKADSPLDAAKALAPLVGRERELENMLGHWAEALHSRGNVVVIAGEAGVGKTRLLHAIRSELSTDPHHWLECRSTAYNRESAFHPLTELLSSRLGFDLTASHEAKLASLEDELTKLGLALPAIAPFLAPLLSIVVPGRYPPRQESPERQRELTIEALAEWILGHATQRPTVLVVEDLHWCDPSTLELLGTLIGRAQGTRLLLILTHRSEYEPPTSFQAADRRLEISRLGPESAAALVRGTVPELTVPETIVSRIVERADGIPLFLEELTKTVADRLEAGGEPDGLSIPATLQDSLMARLDRLDRGKAVAQRGAALGREFSYELIEATASLDEPTLRSGLEELVNAELVFQEGSPPAATYAFKHALVQDTAYQSLLRSVRQPLHGKIAAILEENFPERAEAEPETVARHYDEAGLSEQAIAHYGRAAMQARGRLANQEAIAHVGRALTLLEAAPHSALASRQELELQLANGFLIATARGWADPNSQHAYARARSLASELGDREEAQKALVALSTSYCIMGDNTTGIRLAEEALEAAESLEHERGLPSAHATISIATYYQGDYERTVERARQAIALFDAAGEGAEIDADATSEMSSRCVLASSEWALGYPDRALSLMKDTVDTARKSNNPFILSMALYWQADIHFARGELDETVACTHEAISLGERFGFPIFMVVSRMLRARARSGPTEREGSLLEIEQGKAAVDASGTGLAEPWRFVSLGFGLWHAGRHDDAIQALRDGLESARQTGQHFLDAQLLHLQADVLMDRDGAPSDEVERTLWRSLAVARDQKASSYELRAATRLARLLRDRAEAQGAGDLLTPVYESVTEGFETADLKSAKRLLESL